MVFVGRSGLHVSCIPNQAIRCYNTEGEKEEVMEHRANLVYERDI